MGVLSAFCMWSLIFLPIFLVPSRRTDIHAFLALREPFISFCATFLSIYKQLEAPEQLNQGYRPFH
jgi:hypothetical protein